MTRALPLVLTVLVSGMLAPSPSAAQEKRGPFSQGRLRISGGAGGTFTGDNNYLILGLGAGYFIYDGLEVGLESDFWLLGDPTVVQLSPQVRYVFHFIPVVKPYVGGFYRHWFVSDDVDDLDSLGARGGIFLVTRGGSYFGGGVIYERIVTDGCGGLECTQVYPELALSISL